MQIKIIRPVKRAAVLQIVKYEMFLFLKWSEITEGEKRKIFLNRREIYTTSFHPSKVHLFVQSV